jgi:predicted nuclease of predicted toxin-antitoxin system
MAILLDQCVQRKFLRLLISWGYEASLLQDHIKPDADDITVIDVAQQLDAVLLTEDMDFANILDYPPQDYAGIIVIRYQAKNETEVINTLKQALDDLYRDDLRGVLVVIAEDRYRIRRGPETSND